MLYTICGIFLLSLIATTTSEDVKSPKIIIVGAGASGIAAASKLLDNGFENLLILEAENRIGGRVNTVKFDEYWVDLGAQWIHGQKGNVVWELVADLNITSHSPEYTNDIFTSSGELLDPEIANNVTNGFDDSVERIITNEDQCQSSFGECVENKLRKEVFPRLPELNETMRESLVWLFNMMELGLNAADDWHDISIDDEFKNYFVPEGDMMVNWERRGYSNILDVLMKKFPNPEEELPVLNKTILNAEVTKVDSSSEDGTVKVTTLDGKEYTADHVIMTPSLGVLKEQYETLFHPQLPEYKIRNIKALGFGNAAKIFLLFNNTEFITKDSNSWGFSILWTKEERQKLDSDLKTKWMAYAYELTCVFGKPRLMYIWVSGKGARLLKDLTDDELLEQTAQMVHNLLSKDYNVTKPIALIRSRWSENKHFQGTYSYRSMETARTNSSALKLSQPIMKDNKPVILFGGEASNPISYATVHGAVASGWREAERLISLYKNNSTTESTAVI